MTSSPESFIGVTEGQLCNLSILKSQALLFDRIAVLDLRRWIDFMKYDWHGEPAVGAELSYLIDAEVIYEPDLSFDDVCKALGDDPSIASYLLQSRELLGEVLYELADPKLFRLPIEDNLESVDRSFKKLWRHKEALVRAYAIGLQKLKHCEAVCVCENDVEGFENEITQQRKSEVLHIVFNSMPTPAPDTPWESILEYRSDRDSRSKLLQLRNWMTDVAKGDMRPSEIKQKLEWLIDEYESHMRLHKMKIYRGTWETLVTVGVQLLENTLKFKWSTAVQVICELRQRQIRLLEAEAKAPGREVAYVVKARSTVAT